MLRAVRTLVAGLVLTQHVCNSRHLESAVATRELLCELLRLHAHKTRCRLIAYSSLWIFFYRRQEVIV